MLIIENNRHPGINLGSTDPETHESAESLLFGFWIFLMADLVLFALLFATYASMSVHGVAGVPSPYNLFHLEQPFMETVVLLTSSFTFSMASLSLKYDRDPRGLIGWLLATGFLGALFVGMELSDFHSYITAYDASPQRSGFLSAFYTLVGTHGAHVSAGLIWMLVMLAQIAIFGVSRHVKLRIMRLGIFWHMLDVVWVGIFTFVYLTGAIS